MNEISFDIDKLMLFIINILSSIIYSNNMAKEIVNSI